MSCSEENYHKGLNGGYYLSAIDVRSDMVLGYEDGEYGVGIIGSTVYAVGQNEDFIILKQHPRNFPDEPDSKITNYYIIPLKAKINKSIDRNFYGPLNLREFDEKLKDLNHKKIVFSLVFKDLE